MRIIKKMTVREYCQKHEDARGWLMQWMVTVERAQWQTLAEVRKTYPRADAASDTASGSTVTIFDVKGNRYRLVVAIHYAAQRVYIRDFLTHAEYGNQLWKRRH